jgi:hypothetical protein
MKKVQRGATSDSRINMHTERDKKNPIYLFSIGEDRHVHGRSDVLRMTGGSRSHWSLTNPQHCFQALWQYRGMSSLATALRIKLTEVLYVPRAWHWFSLLRCQVDTSRSAHLG